MTIFHLPCPPTFQLTYARAASDRVLHDAGITGPDIDDSRDRRHQSCGDWHDETGPTEDGGMLFQWFRMALNESVHEALEWFQVAEEPLLDPHSTYDARICAEVERLAYALWPMAQEQIEDRFRREPEPVASIEAP